MKPNRIKELLRAGKTTCGSWISLCSPLGAEVMGLAGFDWLLIDMEHGPGDYQTLISQLQAIQAAGDSVPIVRVQWNDAAVIKRVLDAGALGVMVPGVRSAAEAQQAILATRYPPQGVRGMANVRATRFGLDADYYAQANANIAMFLQIENADAVRQINDILALPGIDVAFIGPSDLSADMGHPGDPAHPDVQRAILRVEQAAAQRGIPLGTVSRSWDGARALLDKGYRAVSLLGDIPFLLQAARGAVASFRDHPHVAAK